MLYYLILHAARALHLDALLESTPRCGRMGRGHLIAAQVLELSTAWIATTFLAALLDVIDRCMTLLAMDAWQTPKNILEYEVPCRG